MSLKPRAPFKYNPSWVTEEELKTIVKDNWHNVDPKLGYFAYEQFYLSLKIVKEKVALWARERCKRRDAQIVEVENTLEELALKNDEGVYCEEDLVQLKHLESLRSKLLL